MCLWVFKKLSNYFPGGSDTSHPCSHTGTSSCLQCQLGARLGLQWLLSGRRGCLRVAWFAFPRRLIMLGTFQVLAGRLHVLQDSAPHGCARSAASLLRGVRCAPCP